LRSQNYQPKSEAFSDDKFKVIFLSYIRLTDRVAKTWFLNELKTKDIEVKYWDLVGVLRENHNEYAEITPDYLKVITANLEFQKKINQVAESQKKLGSNQF